MIAIMIFILCLIIWYRIIKILFIDNVNINKIYGKPWYKTNRRMSLTPKDGYFFDYATGKFFEKDDVFRKRIKLERSFKNWW